MKTSAYMIAHCDDDFLEQAIDSVINHVEELVFVDGAYKWVAPFFRASGLDPERSWQRTHDILAKYGSKVRYFSGLWDDELHKRAFGYDQCLHDVIIRIDADDVLEFDDALYEDFLKSRKGVAHMEYPYMLTPNQQRLKTNLATTPGQCAIFKAGHFRTPLQHCSYLWLVLTEEERARCQPLVQDYIYEPSVIRTAHLTALRTPRTSVNRSRFYNLQYVRITGHNHWSNHQAPAASPDARILQILDFMSADDYTSFLEGHEIVSGFASMQDFKIAPYHFAEKVSDVVSQACANYDHALAELLDFAARPRVVVSEMPTMINVTQLLRRKFSRFDITFADDMVSANGHLQLLFDSDDDQAAHNPQAVHCQVNGKTAHYSFDLIDDLRVLQAVFTLLPIAAQERKTRIVDLIPVA